MLTKPETRLCTILLFLLLSAISTRTHAASPGLLNDDLNGHFLAADVLAQGLAPLGLPGIAAAFATNPADLDGEQPLWSWHLARLESQEIFFQRLDASEQYRDAEQYSREAVGVESVNHVRPLGRWGVLALAVGVQHEGKFQRVNSDGQQVNRFARSLWSWGIGYRFSLSDALHLGADIRRLRVRPLDEDTSPVGWGYVSSVGLTCDLGEYLTLGVSARNLTNGVSLHPPVLEARIDPQYHVSVRLGHVLEDRIALTGGWSFPGHEEMRFGAGFEVAPWEWLQLQTGYVNDVQRRQTSVIEVATQQESQGERLWKLQGVSLGSRFSWSGWSLTVAWAPQLYPRAGVSEKMRIVSGTSQFAFSLSHR